MKLLYALLPFLRPYRAEWEMPGYYRFIRRVGRVSWRKAEQR